MFRDAAMKGYVGYLVPEIPGTKSPYMCLGQDFAFGASFEVRLEKLNSAFADPGLLFRVTSPFTKGAQFPWQCSCDVW